MTTTQLQLRRDTTANIGTITPAQGEPIYDVSRKALALGDGATAGGGSIIAPMSYAAWTPILFGGTTAGTPTYTQQDGVYFKSGSLVMAWFSLAVSALGSMAGNVMIGGLPLASLSESVPLFDGSVASVGGVTLTAGYSSLALIMPASSGSAASLIQSGSNVTSIVVQASALAASTGLVGSIRFLTSF